MDECIYVIPIHRPSPNCIFKKVAQERSEALGDIYQSSLSLVRGYNRRVACEDRYIYSRNSSAKITFLSIDLMLFILTFSLI